MDHYLDIRLRPDPEFTATVLMSALFAKLHRGLVSLGTDGVGVSFPEVEKAPVGLGEKLRLHGTEADLQELMATAWLTGMRDHVQVLPPRPVPRQVRYRTVRRVQAKSSPERLRRRWIRRKGLTEEAARRLVPDTVAERLDLPYVTLTSRSTGQKFRLFIEHGPLLETPVGGRFSSYGLSPTATVPWF